MKKTVVTFGLISGAVSSAMMLLTVPFIDVLLEGHRGEILGYTAIVLSFLLVYFGIRSYRDNVGGGSITFGRAFTVGILITLVSCVFYVATWELIYFKLAPGFGDKFTTAAIERVRASGASPEKIEETRQQMQMFKNMYDNPLTNAAISFVEPFPVGLVVTLVSAAVLRRRQAGFSPS